MLVGCTALILLIIFLELQDCTAAKKNIISKIGAVQPTNVEAYLHLVLGLVDEFQKWVTLESNESFWA